MQATGALENQGRLSNNIIHVIFDADDPPAALLYGPSDVSSIHHSTARPRRFSVFIFRGDIMDMRFKDTNRSGQSVSHGWFGHATAWTLQPS